MASMIEIPDDHYDRIVKVLSDVTDERSRQIAKWGGAEGDGVENPNQPNGIRLRVLAEEFGEVAEAMGRPEDGNGKRDLRTELVQVAAVAVAWVEALDHQEAITSARHATAVSDSPQGQQ